MGLIWDICYVNRAYYYFLIKEGGIMFARIFLDHPRSINENFFQHMVFALSFAIALLSAGAAALVHAFIPCLFEKTAGEIINRLHERIESRS